MNRVAKVLGVTIALAASCASLSASADPCGPCADSVCEHFDSVSAASVLAERAPLLFLGVVVKAETLPNCDRFADVTFRVRRAWKGVDLTKVTVRTGGGCGEPFPFAIGREYLVAATGDGRRAGELFCGFIPLESSAAAGHVEALDAWRQQRASGGHGGA